MPIEEAIEILEDGAWWDMISMPPACDSAESLKLHDAVDMAIAALHAQQALVGVHGQWQGEGDGYADGEIVYDVWKCSQCGYTIDDGTDDPDMLPNYCPDCGAKMDLLESDAEKEGGGRP